jgi:ribosome-associated translation inhibitor RaiA
VQSGREETLSVQVRILSRSIPITPDLRRLLERGARLAIGRYSDSVSVARLNLARGVRVDGGDMIQCTIRARLRCGESIVVDEQADDPQKATSLAACRLERMLRRRRQIESATGPRRSSSTR